MKILALNLGGEEVCQYPTNYGGCGRTLRLLAKNIPDFYIAGNLDSFKNTDIKIKNCHCLSQSELKYINDTNDLSWLDKDYDLIFHTRTNQYFSTSKKTLVWCPGDREEVNPLNNRVLLQSRKQNPIITNPETKIYEFVLGVDIPETFVNYKKYDYLLQCSNHYPQIQSHVLANLCNKNQIKCYFAGPVSDNYKQTFFSNLDLKHTFYLGEIIENVKIELMKGANFVAGLYAHHTNSPSLQFKQGLSLGCGVISLPMQQVMGFIQNNINGFLIQNEQDFLNAWMNRGNISQRACWTSAQPYSNIEMIKSFENVINIIKNE